MNRPGQTATALVALTVIALALGAPASAQIYWANEGGDSVGRADLDGNNVDQSLITGASDPRGVAIDSAYVYWAQGGAPGSIGRADLDGNNPNQGFITTGDSPQGVALDATRIYWTQTVSGSGKVGRAGLDGSGASQSFIATGSAPCGVAADADKVYWANTGIPGSIASAHGAFTVNQNFITATDDPCGVAVAGSYIYWVNQAGGIGRANLDGTGPDQSFLTAPGACGVAVDGAHVYWTSATTDTVGRADLDGMNPDASFITGAQDPCGIAVAPTFEAVPPDHSFEDTEMGQKSTIQAFFIANTSSSVLDVSGVSLVGSDVGDFEITGDGCTVNVVPPGSGCVLNVRLTPTVGGTRSATLRVAGNATNSPADIPLTGEGVPDTTPPGFLSAAIRPSTFAVDANGAPETPLRAAANGTKFRYSLSEAAGVTFTIKRKLAASRFKPIGRFAQEGVAGLNKKAFSGKIGNRSLHPDTYIARLGARDDAGNRAAPRSLRFHVVP